MRRAPATLELAATVAGIDSRGASLRYGTTGKASVARSRRRGLVLARAASVKRGRTPKRPVARTRNSGSRPARIPHGAHAASGATGTMGSDAYSSDKRVAPPAPWLVALACAGRNRQNRSGGRIVPRPHPPPALGLLRQLGIARRVRDDSRLGHRVGHKQRPARGHSPSRIARRNPRTSSAPSL